MIATSATDKRIFIWRLQVQDFFSDDDAMLDEPRVEVMFQAGVTPVPIPLSSSTPIVNMRVGPTATANATGGANEVA